MSRHLGGGASAVKRKGWRRNWGKFTCFLRAGSIELGTRQEIGKLPLDTSAPLIPAVSVALVDRDRVLLVKRGRAPSKGFFAFPGGRVEAGESLEEAARRELFEETALRCGPLSLTESLDIARERGTPPFRLHVFAARYIGGAAVAGDDAESADWFTLDDMAARPVLSSVVAVATRLLGSAGGPESGVE